MSRVVSKEIETRHFAVERLDADGQPVHGTQLAKWLDRILAEVLRRVMKGWTLTGIALTFERPIRTVVTARPKSVSSGGHNKE